MDQCVSVLEEPAMDGHVELKTSGPVGQMFCQVVMGGRGRRLELVYQDVREFMEDELANRCVGAFFAPCPTPLKGGSALPIHFHVPGMAIIRTRAQVLWSVTPEEAGVLNPGMGLRFEALGPRLEHAMDALNATSVY